MKKKLMLLGGIRYLLPVIEAAHKMGVYVITADYLPDNIAHKYSDEYANVSIIDRDAVLKVAQEKRIDGIMSFGVDPGVVTAAYVAEKMGLPSPPFKAVEILQNKNLFRDFLAANDFNCPFHKSYVSRRDVRVEADSFPYPIMVKPVDSAGSKGVMRVDSVADLGSALDSAFAAAHNGHIIVEKFLELDGCQSSGECFSIDGRLVFSGMCTQYFDKTAPNAFAPVANCWPNTLPEKVDQEIQSELQRLIGLLGMGTSIYNVEARQAKDGKVYLMEVSPRGGGNRLAEILRLATGQDLIENNVRFALGLELNPMRSPEYDGVWLNLVLHSNRAGEFKELRIENAFRKAHVREECVYVKPGDAVREFNGANQAMGTLFLRFDSWGEAESAIRDQSRWMEIIVT